MENLLHTKRFLFTLFSVLLFTGNSFSQVWEAKNDMPTARKEIADAATTLDGKIYVLGGRTDTGSITNVFEMYDVATDTWTTLAPYPLSVWRASVEALDGKIYAMGGYQSLSPFPFNPTNQAFVYDIATNTWSPIQDIVLARASAATVVLDGKIHLMGGANFDALFLHHAYNPTTDSWEFVANMIFNRSGLTAAVIDGKIYVVGGYFLDGSGLVSRNSVEFYDPANGGWQFRNSLPFSKLGISSAVVQGEMYVFGNENNANVLKYNPANDIWEELIAMPENVNFAGAVTVNDIIYVMGGGQINLTADGINDMNSFNPALLSIQENNLEKSFLVYPNPSRGKVSIQFKDGAIKLKVRTVTGKMIKEISISLEKRNIEIDFPFSNGLYFIEIKFLDGKHAIQKLILER
jgi:N-acetylneuraminic acid mutarotase